MPHQRRGSRIRARCAETSMKRKSVRDSIGEGLSGEGRKTISNQRKHELEEQEKQLSHFFQFDQLLNFNGNYGGFRTEDYDQQTSWFFYFIDIIYVATIFNISHLITKCGEDPKVYVMAASYFSIMFSTRMFFDTFTSILHANGVLHTLIFIMYGLGVYVMTLNIAAVTDSVPLSEVCEIIIEVDDAYFSVDDIYLSDAASISDLTSMAAFQKGNATNSAHQFGTCHQVEHYDFGFAISFLFTRCLVFLLFILYCTIFHKVKASNDAPHGRTMSTHSAVELPSMSVDRTVSINKNHKQHSGTQNKQTGDQTTSPTARSTVSTAAVQEDPHYAHMRKVFVWKIVPLILSSLVMLFTFGNYSTVIIFPLVAGIEFCGDIIPELLINMQGLKPDRHNLEERLGLMFMLVLGENMLGFLVQRGNAIIELKTYATVIPAYILVIAVGMQYFKNAQFPYLEPGKHPLDRPLYSAAYIWLNGLLSFMMLVAANGLVEIYNDISDLGVHSNSNDERAQKRKISVGLFAVWIIMLMLHLLEGTYWDVIVTAMWGKLRGTRRSSCCAGGANTAEGGGVLDDAVGTVDKSVDAQSSTVKQNPLHASAVAATSHIPPLQQHYSTESASAGASAAYMRNKPSDEYRHSVADNAPERDSFRHSSVTRRSLFYTPAQIEEHIIHPPVFNKRLFFLKVGVAIIHLATFRFQIDSQYFVVVTAIVALLPQFLEVVIEFVDLHNRVAEIKRELQLRVDDQSVVEDGCE